MRGRILEFSLQASEGFITTHEDGRYRFTTSQWKSEGVPQVGQLVDFEVDDQGRVVRVYALPQAPQPGGGILDSLPAFMQLKDKPKSAYSPVDWFLYCLHNYADFNGRAARSEFWYFALGAFVVYMIATTLDNALFGPFSLWDPFTLIASLGLLIPGLAVSARRLQDTGRSGWWSLLGLIPLVGSIVLLIWWCAKGSDETNVYGPPSMMTAG